MEKTKFSYFSHKKCLKTTRKSVEKSAEMQEHLGGLSWNHFARIIDFLVGKKCIIE
ncbi:MAG: hypothetical protein KBA33_03950 [Cloacibacterium sp.]|nr:hypothetical protein [Cloacibacterium sp.]